MIWVWVVTKRLLIDKKTLKVTYVDIIQDGYSDFPIIYQWMHFNNSYFTLELEPHQIAETSEKLHAHPENHTQELTGFTEWYFGR